MGSEVSLKLEYLWLSAEVIEWSMAYFVVELHL